MELWRFYVDRPWRGRGLAQRLMAAARCTRRLRLHLMRGCDSTMVTRGPFLTAEWSYRLMLNYEIAPDDPAATRGSVASCICCAVHCGPWSH